MKNYGPFIKWAGGKGQLLSELEARFPQNFGKTVKKYAEPFVGGGALLFHVLKSFKLDEIYINDVNAELICTYKAIRENCTELIERLNALQHEFIPLDENHRKDVYYKNRDRYNTLKIKSDLSVETASLFIFLNRTCFNGLYRVNSKGLHNVPMGSYANPMICDEELLKSDAIALSHVSIHCGDYKDSETFIDNSTFVYFDPPYRPLSTTASFTAYAKDDFNDENQKELAKYIKKLDAKGAFVLASNSDPKNTCPEDCFFDDIYSGMNIQRVFAKRNINSKGSERGKITELLISNY